MKRAVGMAIAVLLLAATGASGAWLSAGGPQGEAAITILEQSFSGTTFEVTVPGIEVTRELADGREYNRIGIPGQVMATAGEGRPQVPKVAVLLGIPTGASVSAEVLERETVTLELDDVYPLQPPELDGAEPGELVIDREFYATGTSWPERDVAVKTTGRWRDLDVANIQVYPVRVNPAEGEVEVAKRVRVRVDYNGGSYPRTVAEWMLPQYGRFLDNFAELKLRPETDYTPGVRYLVICHDNWSANSYLTDSLLGWVEKRGYDVRMITGSGFTAQQVKDSIRAEYDNHTPATLRWVLLVGEYAEIPTGSYSGVGKSDFWYMDLEPWPSGDIYPEVGLARLSPENATDLENQIAKILKYQKDPATTNNWLEKLTMVAHREQYPGKYSGCVRGVYHMPKPYWDPTLDTIMGQYKNNTDVTNAVNDGVGILAYRGHGNTTVWSGWCGSDWTNSNVEALNNGDLTPVTHHWACICGDISASECHIEAWMRKYPGGAASALGATQASYTYPNHGQCSTLVRATCDTWTITVPGVRDYVGPVFDIAGQMMYMDAYIAKYWPGSPYYYNAWMYLTLGDPSMPVWSGGMPQAPDVTYPGVVPVGPYDLNVTVSVGGQPVEDALVCAWKDGEFYVVERTNASGVAIVSVNATTPGQFSVTVSEGHAQHSVGGATHTPVLPYEGTCMAQTGGAPYVSYMRHTINDSVGGNGDGSVNPGEAIVMPVWVRNWGDSTAYSLMGKLRTSDGYITVTDSAHDFGDLPGQDSTWTGADGFDFEVAVGCTNGHLIQFELELKDASDSTWNSNIYVRVGAADLAFDDYVANDTVQGGNGNGRLDPNETADIVVWLSNVGFGHANSVTAILVSGDARMTVNDSFGDFGQIMADSTGHNGANPFRVTTGNMAPETQVPCTLHISAAGGYTKTVDFSILVGEVRQVDPIPDTGGANVTYWAYDDADSGYAQAPQFNWIEISGTGTRLDLSDDDVEVVSLGSFGPFVYYGQSYSQITVCSNGFVCPGSQSYSAYTNQSLPYSSAPPMLALHWDDWYPPDGGGVWYYHDAANHRFIVEWDSVEYWNTDEWDKMQVVLYDTTMAGPDGNCSFLYQHLTANRAGSCTMGEQDHTKTVFIQNVFDGSYHRGAAPITAGSATFFTTEEPMTGVSEPGTGPSGIPKTMSLGVRPNPFHRFSTVRWQIPVPGRVRLAVYDVGGRLVRTLVDADMTAGRFTSRWDGNDNSGRQVANGTYLYKLETEGGLKTTKSVLLR